MSKCDYCGSPIHIAYTAADCPESLVGQLDAIPIEPFPGRCQLCANDGFPSDHDPQSCEDNADEDN